MEKRERKSVGGKNEGDEQRGKRRYRERVIDVLRLNLMDVPYDERCVPMEGLSSAINGDVSA